MARAQAATRAQAEADAKATMDPAGGGVPETTNLEQPEVRVGESWTLTGTTGSNQSVLEQVVLDAAIPEAEEVPHMPGAEGRGDGQPREP